MGEREKHIGLKNKRFNPIVANQFIRHFLEINDFIIHAINEICFRHHQGTGTILFFQTEFMGCTLIAGLGFSSGQGLTIDDLIQ